MLEVKSHRPLILPSLDKCWLSLFSAFQTSIWCSCNAPRLSPCPPKVPVSAPFLPFPPQDTEGNPFPVSPRVPGGWQSWGRSRVSRGQAQCSPRHVLHGARCERAFSLLCTVVTFAINVASGTRSLNLCICLFQSSVDTSV